MGNSAPATIYSSTVYSDPAVAYDPDARAKPPRADVVTAANYRDLLHRDPPGGTTDNRWRQVRQGYRGVPYVAIRAIMDLVGGASANVMRRKKNPRARVTFGPGGAVAKSTPLGHQQGRDEDSVPLDDYDHPAARLVRCPNPNESFGEFLAKVVLQNRLTGVGPVWKVGSKLAPEKPVELWALRTPLMYPLYQLSGQYPHGAWRVMPYSQPGGLGVLPAGLGATGALIPGEDVARFLDPHPEIDWDGYSPLTAGATQLDVFDAVEQSRKSAMDRGVNLDVVVVAPGAPKEAAERMQASLENRHMGADKARRAAVFAPELGLADKFSVTTLGAAAKDMDYPTGWEQGLKFVLALFGVPPIIAGLGSAGSYAEAYAARQQFYDRQEDYLNRLAVWFDRECLNPWEEFEGELTLKIKPKPIDDKELREKQYEADKDILTVNQRHALRDRPPVEGGDVPAELYNQWLAKRIMPEPEPDPTAATLGGQGQGEELPGGEGGPPRPDNPQGEGSLAPRKAMSALLDSAGGSLVRPPTQGRRRRKRVRAVVSRVLKSLED